MSESHIDIYPSNKTELYALLAEQLKALTEGEPHLIPNLANASALLFYALPQINWAGFYLTESEEESSISNQKPYLLLGPFQGKTACIRIPFGRGVCGTAASSGEVQLVPDVHQFPGHIACDSASNSELVLPIKKNGQVIGVLDIDSPVKNRFDEEDSKGLQQFVSILEKSLI